MARKSTLVKCSFLAAVLLAAGLLGWACSRTEGPLGAPYAGLGQQLQQTGIWVDGQGEVSVTPDIVLLSLGVQAQAKTVADAQTQAGQAMDKVMTVLRSSGIADKDIQTQSFRIEQVTRFDPKTNTTEVTGYRVSNIVGVKIRKIPDAGKIIDAVAGVGGDLTRINGISFSVDDPKPLLVQARDKAMEDALAKADQLAKGAKVKLGKPLFVSENSGGVPPPRAFDAMPKLAAGAAPSTEISPGELKISLSVQVHFSID